MQPASGWSHHCVDGRVHDHGQQVAIYHSVREVPVIVALELVVLELAPQKGGRHFQLSANVPSHRLRSF